MSQKLESLLHQFFTQHNSWHLQLLSNWKQIIGPLHAHVQVEKIEEDTLILGVFDSCWLQELYLLSPLLLKTINQNLDQPRIKQLRFKKIGVIKKNKTNEKVCAKEPRIVELSRAEKEALLNISDPELAQALKRFLIRCYQEKE